MDMDHLRRDLLDALNDTRPQDIHASEAAEDNRNLRRGACAQSAGLSLHLETSYATVGAAK